MDKIATFINQGPLEGTLTYSKQDSLCFLITGCSGALAYTIHIRDIRKQEIKSVNSLITDPAH